jgi:hypothetical protein
LYAWQRHNGLTMPAIITGSIPAQNYELIRDQIASVLALELANQWVLDNAVPKIKKVYRDAFVPNDLDTEANLINVAVGKIEFDNSTVQKTVATVTYLIDCYAIADTTVATGAADEFSARTTNRIAGMARAILEYPDYDTLGLPAGIIGETCVRSYKLIDKGTVTDALSGTVGRLEFEVNCLETSVDTDTARAINELTCTIYLNDTTDGYFYDYKQADVTVATTGTTLTNAFFSNPIISLVDKTTGNTYVANADYTQSGTTLTATTFTFTATHIINARTA